MMELKNILIIRNDRIGDLVLTLPLAGIIKKHYPETRITFFVKDYTRALAECNPYIDEILTLPEEIDKAGFADCLKIFRKGKYDAVIIVNPKFRTSLISFLAGIKTRVGSGYRWYSFLFNKKVFEHRKYAERHELEFNVRLLEKIGIKEKVSPSNVNFGLVCNDQDIKKIKQLLYTKGVSFLNPVVIIHPGSLGSAVDLPENKMKQLISILAHDLSITILITGSGNEKVLCQEMAEGTSAINLAGMFSLKELTALYTLSDIMIANSTGPVHIAAALGVYIIGFYPKITACSPERWGPYTEKRSLFQPEIKCSNCTREQCEKLNCMNSINLENVVKAVAAAAGQDVKK
jgi:ADP-heptose:LPS heptosyltransferase